MNESRRSHESENLNLINSLKFFNVFKVDESARELLRVHESWRSNESESSHSHQHSSTIVLVRPQIYGQWLQIIFELSGLKKYYTTLKISNFTWYVCWLGNPDIMLVPWSTSCFVLFCYAVSCRVVVCFVALCCVMLLCYVMVWYGMVWYVMLCYGMVWCGIVWYVMLWYGMVRYVMVWYGMVWYVMLCYGMVWYGTLCYVMLCYFFFIFLNFLLFVMLSRVR